MDSNETKDFWDISFETKDIWLRKENRIIGLHAIGHSEDAELKVQQLDGTVKLVKVDFVELEKWGNEYNDKMELLGPGSFRMFELTIEHAAQDLEKDGWVRFEFPKCCGGDCQGGKGC